MVDKFDPSRRDFLKKLGLIVGGGVVLAAGGKVLYDVLSKDEVDEKEVIEVNINSIKDKPIHLRYNQITKDKDVDFVEFPENKYSMLARIGRCLRRKPVTDAVEDRYKIPRGLLMAMMAQEGMGDPTMPNLGGDGGLGLIHIQAINAHNFGLKTLKRYTNGMRDTKHGELINETLEKCKYELSCLVEYDDRFHPIMAVDCAARFLVDCKNRAGNGTDDRIHAMKLYSGRKYSGIGGYGYNVIEYRATINNITGDEFPNNFSKNIYKDIENCKKNNSNIKSKLSNLRFSIDGEISGYEQYLAYFEESMQNFELQKYIDIGTYEENIANKGKKVLVPKERKSTPQNTLIKSEFVDTKQHNSEGFRLYRYKAKKGDSPLSISDRFDERDKNNGDKYKNTGDLNIVKRNGSTATNIKEGDIIYIKVKKNK